MWYDTFIVAVVMPACVVLLGWAAVAVNEAVNRRNKRRQASR